MYKKSDIRSIGELAMPKGGRNLTPIFAGSMFPIKVAITKAEFEQVRGNEELMKDLAIKKLNEINH